MSDELSRLVAILENDIKHLSARMNRMDKRLWALVLLVITGGVAGPLAVFLAR